MSSQTSDNSKRIAKNTLFLYIRQIFVMVVALYTSRVVLATLGETDYGIYNVVGGIVTLFTFLNFAMGCATNRFITFQLGKKDANGVNVAFSNAVVIHTIIAFVILLLGETLGLYFFETQMNIPENRMYAASWVYQLSIFTCMVNIVSIPYNALITSHEKMNAFAVISIVETVLKLVIVWMLVIFGCDKLILYAILMFVVGIIVRILNQAYSRFAFKNIHFLWPRNRVMLKEMLVYAMWSLIGSAGVIFADQGVNVLLNIYFGPTVNAARGVANQVKTAVVSLSNNFSQAVSPQINKSFAGGDLSYMHTLIFAASKYTFYLLFIMFLPICLEANYLLSLWLVEVPAHSVMFLRLMLIISILTALGTPLSNAAGANGNIKYYQIFEGGINLMLIPIMWLVFKFQNKPIPEWAFYVQIFICVCTQIARLLLVRPLINLSLRNYIFKVVKPCLIVVVVSSIIPFILKSVLTETLLSFLLIVFISVACVLLAIALFGVTNDERNFVLYKVPIIRKYSKIKKL